MPVEAVEAVGAVGAVEMVVLAVGTNCFGPVINYPRVVGAGGWPVVRVIPVVMFARTAGVMRGGGLRRVVLVVPIAGINYGFCR